VCSSDLILDLLDAIPAVLAPGARFIGSGIVQGRREEVLRKMATRGLGLIESLEQDEWVALAGRL
jgi:ribosomal protein L11 methyltransferase